MTGWIVAIVAAAAAGYLLGRHRGAQITTRSAIARGSWVEVLRPVRVRSSTAGASDAVVAAGTQAIVTGVDKWGRLSIWIAQPWAAEWGSVPQVFGVTDISALGPTPILAVPANIVNPTLAALKNWEEKVAEVEHRIVPEGFLELQRRLNRD